MLARPMERPSPLSRLLVLALVLGAASWGGCAKKGAGGKDFRVALLTPGSIGDAGWNANAYEGLQEIHRVLDVEVSHQETRTPSEIEQGFRAYASAGYRLVFGHGFEFQDAAARVGGEFPGTLFITTSGSVVRPNVSPMIFRLEEAMYLAGMVAGAMTQSGLIGAVGGIDLPPVRGTFLGFEAGVHAENPRAVVRTVYVGNFDDMGSAKEAALSLVGQGADFLVHNADAAGLGVFQAARDSKGVYAFGSNKDQNDVAPDVVLGSAVLRMPKAFVEVARRAREGTFRPGPLFLGLREGIVDFVWNPKLADRVPPQLRARVEEARKRILRGEIRVPSVEFASTPPGR